MTEERKAKEENLDTVTRRGFIKVAGIGALGMAYATPVIQSLNGSGEITSYSSSLSNHTRSSTTSSTPATV
ncbi:MAG: twin-arginine translocation signal domain-containing protein [Anaerolineales bacterium]